LDEQTAHEGGQVLTAACQICNCPCPRYDSRSEASQWTNHYQSEHFAGLSFRSSCSSPSSPCCCSYSLGISVGRGDGSSWQSSSFSVLASAYLWRTNPEIFVARSKFHHGTKRWDKVVLFILFPSFMAIFPLAGLDWRFQWTCVPPWLVGVGYVLLILGMGLSIWPMKVNKFAEPSVRIQTDRGHTVIDTGPYAIVRHPMYFSAFFVFFGSALALGSFWALIPATVANVVLVVRTALEDRTLQNELPGYREYARRVRYRLMPGVW
jgi:protein-S-isoprenylcysteine O-methyltransferase Ste14